MTIKISEMVEVSAEASDFVELYRPGSPKATYRTSVASIGASVGPQSLQDVYDASITASITYTVGKNLQLVAIGTDDAIGCSTTTNLSGTNNFSIYTQLPDPTVGLEHSEAAFTTLISGVPTNFMLRKSGGWTEFYSVQLNDFKVDGAPSGVRYTTSLGQVPQITHQIEYEGVDATLAVSRFAKRQVQVVSSGLTSSAILRDNVSELDTGLTTTIYQELDGSTKTIRQLKPVEVANRTDAEIAALVLPAKGLVAFNTDKNRLAVQAGTPATPAIKHTAFVEDVYPQGQFSCFITQTVENTVAETSLWNPFGLGSRLIPANTLQRGDVFTIKMGGFMRTDGGGESITLRITNGATVLITTGAIQLNSIATLQGWELELDLSIGLLGTPTNADLRVNGQFTYQDTGGGGDYAGSMIDFANSTTFDTTIDNTWDVTVQWNAASANNTISSRLGYQIRTLRIPL